jgi:two-component system, NtrC family, sensor kinase
MKYSKIVLKLTVMMLFSISANYVNAQQSRVDSVIAMLNKSNTAKGFDTLKFNNARQLIRTAVLSDAQISQLEKVADQFKKGNDEDLCYAVKYVVLVGLTASDKFKAIKYGKQYIQKLENSSTPRAKYLAHVFLSQLRLPYRNSSKLPEGFQYYAEKLNQYKIAKDSLGLSTCFYVLGGFYRNIGLYEPAMYNMKKSISFLDSSDFNSQRYLNFRVNIGKAGWINNSFIIGDFYVQMGEFEKAIKQCEMTLKTAIDYYSAGGKGLTAAGINPLFGARHLVLAKILTNQLDSVDYYLKLAENATTISDDNSGEAFLLQYRSLYNIKRGAYNETDSLLRQCWKLVNKYQITVSASSGFVEPDYYLALLSIEQKKYAEAIVLLLKNIERIKAVRQNVLRDYKLLASLYEKTGDYLKAKEVYKSFINLQDSITADQSKYRTISFETEQQITDNEIAISKLESANKLSAQSRNFTIGIAALLLILAGSIYYRFQSKKKANEVLEKTLTDLKSTQSQLIQSEKMASLGELTAGIAHEIQNPLNFVNNFSEVSSELVDEMNEEMDKGNLTDAKEIANDLKQNLEKINHHGKRAADIVKGMLQHSSSGSGKKEPTNINALADEYLRLCYHGLRAKDKSFNATMKTDFDETISNINIIPQDIGRVILNLITNGFYAVNERFKKTQPDSNYEPTVSVTTKKEGNKVLVSVTDNGGGIPQKILDKIFQPFFTTKPTGQGTGLGLSLSYDIVKAHGGELKVEIIENEGSTFIIQIPTNY